MSIKFKITALLLICALCLFLPRVALTQTETVSITVNGETAQCDGSNFSMLSACGQQQAVIVVTAETQATVKINGITQNPATISLPNYGNNIITVTVTPQNSIPQNYTLIVNKPVPYYQIVVFEFPDVPSINNNPANNGGFTFTSFKWFRNGVLIGTKQYFNNGGPLNPADIYYVEAIDVSAGVIRTCLSTE